MNAEENKIVMVADDAPANIQIATSILKDIYRIRVATNGAKALVQQRTALARPTPAWSEFCQRVPTECGINLGEPEKITLTRATWNTIKAVNRRVNASIIPLSDQDPWGVSDHWDLPDDGYGDCEDIQLLKR